MSWPRACVAHSVNSVIEMFVSVCVEGSEPANQLAPTRACTAARHAGWCDPGVPSPSLTKHRCSPRRADQLPSILHRWHPSMVEGYRSVRFFSPRWVSDCLLLATVLLCPMLRSGVCLRYESERLIRLISGRGATSRSRSLLKFTSLPKSRALVKCSGHSKAWWRSLSDRKGLINSSARCDRSADLRGQLCAQV